MAPLDGLASVQLLASLPGGQMTANTFHISHAGMGTPPTPADLAQLAADVQSWFDVTFRGILSTASTFTAIKTAQVPDPLIHKDAYADYILPLNEAGTRTITDEAAPNQACLCLSLKTNSGQRSYRGHLLLPPSLHARDFNGSAWSHSSAYYTSCVAFASKLQAGCVGTKSWTGTKLASYDLVIFSKFLQEHALPSVTDVITVVSNDAVHWLRSRARGTV